MIVKILVRFAIGLAAVAVLIQLVPYGRDHANPRVVVDAPWPSAQARSIAVQSCYDCHSNETKWRWYSNIAPFSWLVQRDVDNGRAALNFSEWGTRRVPRELHDVVEEGDMPPQKYLLIHPSTKLPDADRKTLVEALKEMEASGRG